MPRRGGPPGLVEQAQVLTADVRTSAELLAQAGFLERELPGVLVNVEQALRQITSETTAP